MFKNIVYKYKFRSINYCKKYFINIVYKNEPSFSTNEKANV